MLKWTDIVIAAVVVLGLAVILAWLTGCASREYEVRRDPNGLTARVRVWGTSSEVGVLEVRTSDGAVLVLRGYSQADTSSEVVGEVVKALVERIPVPSP